MGIERVQRPVRVAGAVVVACLGVLAMVGCERGEVDGTSSVTDVSATLHGTVHSEDPTPRYWFEYDPDPTVVDGQLTFAFETLAGEAGSGEMLTASQQVTRLTPDTTYYYRFCIRTESDTGMCGAPGTFRTKPDDRDVVQGSVGIPIVPQLGYYEGVGVSVRAEPDSSEPVGYASRLPGSSYFRYADQGSTTCLRIVGNRAAIGFVAGLEFGEVGVPQVVFVEDNGPTGDRFSSTFTEETPLDCPDPSAESIVWKNATTGNVTITDNPS